MKSLRLHDTKIANALRRARTAICACAIIFVVLLTDSATAQITRTWTGEDSANWSDPDNWNPFGAPGTGDDLQFFGNDSNDTMTNDLVGLSVHNLGFENNSYELAGNTLTITGSIDNTVDDAVFGVPSRTVTIDCPLAIPNNVEFQTGFAYGTETLTTTDLNLTGSIQLANSALLTLDAISTPKESAGEFGGGNGHIVVSGVISGSGSVMAMGDDAQGDISTVQFSASSPNSFLGTLYLSAPGGSSIIFDDAGGGAVNTTLAVVNGNTANLYLKSPNQTGSQTTMLITLGSRLSLSGNNMTVGMIVMTNVASDADASILDTGSTTVGLNGGILTSAADTPLTPTIKGKINFNGFLPVEGYGSGLDMQAVVEGAGFNKTGPNALQLDGNNTFNGNMEISSGTVIPSIAAAISPTTDGVILNGGRLQMTSLNIGTVPLSVNSPDSLFITYNSCSWAGPVTLDSTLSVLPVDNTRTGLLTTFSGAITGSGGMTLEDAVLTTGNVLFSGSSANTFSGPLTVQCQLLELDKPTYTEAFGGELIAGTGPGSICQVTWLNDYQSPVGSVALYTNGIVDLSGFNDNFGPVTFNAGEIETDVGQLSLYGAVTVNPAGQPAIIGGNITLPPGNSVVFNVVGGYTAGNLDLDCEAAISGAATYLSKQGSGVMSLAGPNSSTSTTQVQGGILAMDNLTALSTTPVVISGGATLKLDVNATLNQGIEMSGDEMNVNGNLGALDVASDAAVTMNGNILLDAETTLNLATGSSLALGGPISGTGSLTKTGLGLLVINGNSANTYSGTTYVNQGTLSVNKQGIIHGIPGNLVIGTKTSLLGTSGNAATAQCDGGNIGGNNVTVNGGSVYEILNNGNQTLASVNLVNGGSIIVDGIGTLGLTAGPTADVVSVSPGQSGASVISGDVYLINGGNFTVGARLTGGTTPELNLQGGLNDDIAGGISKSGAGQMQLSAANSFSSQVTVNAGTLTLTNSGSLGNSPSTTVNGNGALKLENGITINNNALTLNSSNSASLLCVGGANAWTGPITLEQTCGISIQPGTSSLYIPGVVSGPGGLTTIGSGTLQFEGTNANTYAGVTTIGFGVLDAGRSKLVVGHDLHGQPATNEVDVTSIPGDVVIGSDTAGGTTATLRSERKQQFTITANVAVHLSGLLDLAYVAGQTDPPIEYAQTLTGSGEVNIEGATAFTIYNSVPFIFDGTINGAGIFNKEGSGTMTTWGNINTTGKVQMLGGSWELYGARHNGGITVEGLNGNAWLNGDGSVDGDVTVSTAGGAAAGVSVDSHYPDHQGSVLHVGSLTNSLGVNLQLEMFGPSPTGGNDQIATTSGGVLLQSDTTLSTTFNYPPHEGDVIDLISVASGQTISGTFSNFPDGVVTLVGQTPVVPSYHGGAGNDFTLTVTNLALAYAGYQLAGGNVNQTVEPNQCNLIYVSLVNHRTSPVTITNAYLRATNATGVVVTSPVATYPVIATGQTAVNETPFQFKTDTNLPCGGAVGFELVLGVVNEGQFAIGFNPLSGTDCSNPTGQCDSCTIASGQFTTNTLTTMQPLFFVGGPSMCFPPKAYPGPNPAPPLAVAPYLTHSFTNDTTNAALVTAELDFDCPTAPANALGVAAYIGVFDPANPSVGYLGDIGQGGPPYPTFSFQVPPETNFTLVVMSQTTNLICENYKLQIFGLTCPPPSLTIEPDSAPETLRVDWSTAYPGWTAQQAATPIGPSSASPQTPAIVNGRYALTNIAPTTNQFFWLKH